MLKRLRRERRAAAGNDEATGPRSRGVIMVLLAGRVPLRDTAKRETPSPMFGGLKRFQRQRERETAFEG